MQLRMRIPLTVVALVGVGVGGWLYLRRGPLKRQYGSYRVGSAATFAEAKAEIARLEAGPNPNNQLHELVRKWGTGNQRFDLYLARYVGHRGSSELLRKTFSLEFGWREELLPRWAHYWSWRSPLKPDRQIDSIAGYLDVLASADPPKTITWREVLDLQAVFQLTRQPNLAQRLSPTNWPQRYRRWPRADRAEIPHIARPAKPFADWRGPVPKTVVDDD